MNAIAVETHEKTPATLQPVFTRLLPGMASALALAPAVLSYELPGTVALVVVPLLWVQVLLLALGAMSLASTAHERLRPWEGRVAPASARERVRRQLLRDLGWTGAIGLAGPLVLGAMLDWQARELRLLPGAVALLSAAMGAGLLFALCWKGRAARPLMLPALLLLAALSSPAVIREIAWGEAMQSLAILGGAGLLWAWLSMQSSLAVVGPAWPRPEPLAWWRRRWAHRLWRGVPFRAGGDARKRQTGGSPLLLFIWAPQFQMHARHMGWLSWERDYGSAWAALGYGLWLLFLGIVTGFALIAPPVHWRHRLAPGGLSAKQWSRRLVLGSLLAFTAVFSVGLGLAALNSQLALWPDKASAWTSAMGDVLLAGSAAAWLRGRNGNGERGLWMATLLVLAAPAVLGALILLGATPERGPIWLFVQLALTVLFARAAVRAWARQDLGTMP